MPPTPHPSTTSPFPVLCHQCEASPSLAVVQRAAPFVRFRTVAVEHCRDAYALVLAVAAAPGDGHGTLRSPRLSASAARAREEDEEVTTCTQSLTVPFSLVFSGDCRPSEALVVAGHGATVLVHEATFEDRLVVGGGGWRCSREDLFLLFRVLLLFLPPRAFFFFSLFLSSVCT